MGRQELKYDPAGEYDTQLTAAIKINAMTDEIYSALSNLETTTLLQPDNVNFIYHSLLYSSPFKKCFYDIFREEGTVTLGGSPIPTYDAVNQCYLGHSGSTLVQKVIEGSTSYNKIYINVEKDPALTITVTYSFDGTVWESAIIGSYLDVSAFTDLYIKITWTGSGNIYSFGVLYDHEELTYVSRTRWREVYTVPTFYDVDSLFTIPGSQRYTVDGKSLRFYVNGIRLFNGVDYEEVDNKTIRLLRVLEVGDIVVCEEDIGYIDSTEENRNIILAEHNEDGTHALVDVFNATNIGVRSYAGSLKTILNNSTNFDENCTYSYTNGLVTRIEKVNSLGTLRFDYTYNEYNDLVTVTTYLNDALVKTITYTYAETGILSGIAESYA